MRALCGAAFVHHAVHIEAEGAGMRLTGWIALPTFSRSQADLQYFYVNGRMVRDKLVIHALKQAYHDVLYRDRYPAYILFLEIMSTQVDVNVHPTKHEVRFRDARTVHDFISRSAHDALAHVKAGTHDEKECSHDSRSLSTRTDERVESNMSQSMQSSYRESGLRLKVRERNAVQPSLVQEQLEIYRALHADTHIQMNAEPVLGHALCQIQGIYILAENAQGLVMMDMHAAHERIVYEKMKAALAKQNMPVQTLLVPLMISLSEREANAVEQATDLFQPLGFSIQRMSKEMISVREVPQLLAHGPIEQLIRDIVSDLLEHGESYTCTRKCESIIGHIGLS